MSEFSEWAKSTITENPHYAWDDEEPRLVSVWEAYSFEEIYSGHYDTAKDMWEHGRTLKAREIIYRWKSFEEWYEAKCFNHHLEVRREAFDAARETKEREE